MVGETYIPAQFIRILPDTQIWTVLTVHGKLHLYWHGSKRKQCERIIAGIFYPHGSCKLGNGRRAISPGVISNVWTPEVKFKVWVHFIWKKCKQSKVDTEKLGNPRSLSQRWLSFQPLGKIWDEVEETRRLLKSRLINPVFDVLLSSNLVLVLTSLKLNSCPV